MGDGGIAHINQRGRWSSDVAQVYQRATVGRQLQASADMGDMCGEDIEGICAGWAQPASFRG
eukprot:4029743-Pleurochrysis_carterae.AAC.1